MNDNELRNALLGLENFSPHLKEKYEKKLRNIIEKPLKPWERVTWCLWAFIGLCFMVGFAAIALFVGPDLPWQGRIAFAFGSLFGTIWLILCLIIVKKGSFNLKRDSFILGGVIWAFLIIMTTIFLVLGSQMDNTAKGVLVIVSNLTFLVGFGLILMWGRIGATEQRLRENLLRLELQLVDLSERLGGGKGQKTSAT